MTAFQLLVLKALAQILRNQVRPDPHGVLQTLDNAIAAETGPSNWPSKAIPSRQKQERTI